MGRDEVFAEVARRAAADGLRVYAHSQEEKAIISVLRDPAHPEGCVCVSMSGRETPTAELLDSRYNNAVRALRNGNASQH